MAKNIKVLILLTLIILLGSFLRLYKLDQFPPSLFGDEVDVGYQAYSILKTGRDYMGQSWPVSFHSWADWRTPLFLYSAVPFVAIFGLNEFGVRLPAAIFGILTLPFFFLLIKKLFENEKIALLGTFFLSISVWHLQYSRAAFEVTQMLFLLVTGTYFFLRGLDKWQYLVPAAILLALTPYSYNTAKLFLPLFLMILFFCFWGKIKKINPQGLFVVGAVFILISLPLLNDLVFGKAGERFSILSIFTDPTTIPQIGFDRQADLGEAFDPLLSRVFHNKFQVWGLTLLQNYLRAFSTDFLFLKGDINFRHSVQGGFGQFYWLDALFFIMGLFFLLTKSSNKSLRRFIFFWFFAAPIPSVLTRDGGTHATRLILMLPPFLLIISFGAYKFWELIAQKKQKFVFLSILGLIFIIQFSFYLHRYYIHYPLESEEWWHYGFKQLAVYVKENEDQYDYVIWSDREQPPLLFSLFWLKIDPRVLQENKLNRTQISDAIWADHLPNTKYYYGHVSEERITANDFIGTLKPNILYLTPKLEVGRDFRYAPLPNSIRLLETIYYPSGRVAKYILTGL